MSIPIGEIKGVFSKALIAVFTSQKRTTNFLRSFFVEEISNTLNVSIQVRQGTSKVAVDVARGTEGNLNASSYESEKIIQPPYYEEKINANELDFYDKVFGSEGATAKTVADSAKEFVEDMNKCRDMIERAMELQCAQIFDNGQVQLKKATNINYKRKAASIQATALNDWLNQANDPAVDFKKGAKFLRENGNTNATAFDCILGGDALDALLNNAKLKEKSDLKDVDLNSINAPQALKESVGAMFHGELSAGSFRFRLWTYPQFYTAANGAKTYYINEKKMIMLPPDPDFKLAFGAVPTLVTDRTTGVPIGFANVRGKYAIQDYIDVTKQAHYFAVKSCPIAVPVEVNAIYTAVCIS